MFGRPCFSAAASNRPWLLYSVTNGGNAEILLQSISRYYEFLPSPQQGAFLSEVNQKAS